MDAVALAPFVFGSLAGASPAVVGDVGDAGWSVFPFLRESIRFMRDAMIREQAGESVSGLNHWVRAYISPDICFKVSLNHVSESLRGAIMRRT